MRGSWTGMCKWKDVYPSMFALRGGTSRDRRSRLATSFVSSVDRVMLPCSCDGSSWY